VRKLKTVPNKFQQNFLATMDHRHSLVKALRTAYSELTDDMGGIESLSHVQKSLAMRFIWLEAHLAGIEKAMACADKEEATRLAGSWVQSMNALSGIAKLVGIERRARKIASLASYVESKSKSK
jgi:uncharacterized protein (DUF2235 family)